MESETRTQKTILKEIDTLVQELVHLEDESNDNDSFLVTGWFIAGTGVSSTDINQFRAIYYISPNLNPILAAGISDYAYSRSREAISKRIHDGKQE